MDFQLYYVSLVSLFLVVAYMIYVDPNVGKFIILLCKLAVIQYHRLIFWIKFYPRLRFDTFILKLRSRRILKNSLKQTKLNEPE